MDDRPLPLHQQWITPPRRRPALGNPWWHLSLAVVPVALLLVAFALAAAPSSKLPDAPVAPVPRSDNFEMRFGEPAPPSPTPVRTIPVIVSTPRPALPDPPPVSEVPVEETIPDQLVHKDRSVESRDICKKYNLRKVMVNKYSWRCRK
jgi:hypothetical protein